jgi:phosphate transport system ATP-binding protein
MENTSVKLETRNLDLFYGSFQALKQVCLVMETNQVTALIGPSGCGKSTFIRTLNRMNDLVDGVTIKGQVLYEGEDIYGDLDPIELRKRIGMVFQKPNPFPMSVYDNVAYGPKLHGIRSASALEQRVEESIKAAALWDEVSDRLHKPALGLSGGQQQRLCIARALAIEPDVLLMDEPTSALDPISTGRIEDLVDELKKDYTIVIVTHNMQQAGRISDRTAFFLTGEVLEQGPTSEIFFNPKDPRTEAYISGKFG